jgi:hypothetical protein
MNTNNTSFKSQRLQFNNCRFHLPRTGKPAWPMVAIYDGGDQLVRDNRTILRNCTIDSGIAFGLYGNNGGAWDVGSSTIAADTALRLKYSILNGVDYFWEAVMQNITPSVYAVEYADIQPYISNGVIPPLRISGLTSGVSVSGSTVITYGGSTPVTPQCSVDGGTWTGCISGITTLAQLPAWNNINVGSTFAVYLRDLTTGGEWSTEVLAGLKKEPISCDINSDGVVNVVDVQLVLNQSLGLAACTADLDLNGTCDIVDVQRVINAALGGSCHIGR